MSFDDVTEENSYGNIMQGYEDRLNDDRRLQRRHRQEIYRKIPALKSLDDEIADISADAAIRSIDGDEAAKEAALTSISRISEKKKALLSEAGFPSDYLEMHYTCSDCQDTGYIGHEKCHCLRQRMIDAAYSQYPTFAKLSEENFNTFSFDFFCGRSLEDMKIIHAASVDFVNKFANTYENMLFYGNVGCGKTFLTNCIAGALLEQGFSVVYLSAFQLFDILNAHTFRSRGSGADPEELYAGLFTCDLLIIDDLGTEILSSAVSSELFQLLNSRDIARLSTIISSNLSLSKLKDNYSERSMSRILGNYHLFKFEGEDIRLMKRRKS